MVEVWRVYTVVPPKVYRMVVREEGRRRDDHEPSENSKVHQPTRRTSAFAFLSSARWVFIAHHPPPLPLIVNI